MVELTESQVAAVTAPISCPLMILAAAGSGKTLVLCYRILHLIRNGVPAKEILAVTFTRRAGQDLLSRLRKLGSNSGISIEGVRVGTFHSFCLSILRAVPSQAKLAPDFTIFTPKMQLELLQELVYEWHLMRSNGQKCEGSLKKQLFRTEAYRMMKQIGQMQRKHDTAALNSAKKGGGMLDWVLERYHSHLQNINAIDFNSFTRRTNDVLESFPGILDSLDMKLQHILVDEFQDTDTGQFKLLQALSTRHHHVTVVGDDDQQIYSWRGAAGIQNLESFSSTFGGATVVKLERNFRSTGAIVAAARSVISRNESRMRKSIGTTAPTGKLVAMCECRNVLCEVAAISNFISSSRAEGVKLSEIAVLYRVHRVGVELQHHLQAIGVPCKMKVTGGSDDSTVSAKGFSSTGEALADILGVLRLILNESDDYACKRLMLLFCPDGRSEVLSCVMQLQQAGSSSLLQSLKTLRSHVLGMSKDSLSAPWIQPVVEKLGVLVKEVIKGAQVLMKIMADTKEELQRLGMKDVVMNLLQQIGPYREEARTASLQISSTANLSGGSDFAGIKALLKEAAAFDGDNAFVMAKTSAQTASKSKNASYKDMRRLQKRDPGQGTVRSSQSDFKDHTQRLRVFLDQVALKLHEYELGEDNKTLSSPSDCVTLSTIHQAKGLEWPAIVLARANEGVLPVFDTDMVSDAQDILEEERRLLYVTLTRAKTSILITYLMKDSGQQALPSRFLAEIPRGLVKRIVSYDHQVTNITATTNTIGRKREERG
ncbi:uncharacterized protein LOC9631646 isoform X1 [Selaginella moellendorffii]|uniref:uncharacterized protein LOC9631646 isoform X1 n=1 Tax=Selaginella moellendorffii TaxID=88036 RepID=UPI000D1CA667|nr:uncharacterized protein LOC9631646 isoform X1 [Selaginella moellendorffii]|eukprot:XP_024529285.1 uncharacterized protein LOC9631646 isoform X1 [Selaginella moellendorffii]